MNSKAGKNKQLSVKEVEATTDANICNQRSSQVFLPGTDCFQRTSTPIPVSETVPKLFMLNTPYKRFVEGLHKTPRKMAVHGAARTLEDVVAGHLVFESKEEEITSGSDSEFFECCGNNTCFIEQHCAQAKMWAKHLEAYRKLKRMCLSMLIVAQVSIFCTGTTLYFIDHGFN